MLSNLLRIFITKQAINTMHEESAKQLAQLEQIQEQPVTQIKNQKDMEAYLEQLKREEKERVRYCSRPIMALETVANMKAFFPILLMLIIVIIGGSIYLIISGLFGGTDIKYSVLAMVTLIVGGMLLVFYKHIQHYLENTMCLYYGDRICIKKYRKKDIVITYDEVKECIAEKKIRIHNGRLEYPYKGGYIFVYTWGEAVRDGFYKFMSDKCGLKIPKIEKTERDIIRRTGIGWVLYTYMAIPFFLIQLFMIVIVPIGDYGFNHTWNEMIAFVKDMLLYQKGSLFGIVGIFFVIIGLVMKLVYYFPAKKHFTKYKDIIKVTLF